jgi:glycosyltransferase involved in cell wall biosynthesis
MKILWVKTDFLHPTERGGQIRTLEILKRLHRRHEVHYLAYHQPRHPDALGRAGEYCSRAHAVEFSIPHRRSLAFGAQLVRNLFDPLPLPVRRYQSAQMRQTLTALLAREAFDSIVCDFLFPASNFPALEDCVLFQHNVEAVIWRRHTEHAPDPLRRWYLGSQARKMFDYERSVCRAVRHIIAVSEEDAQAFRRDYGCQRVSVTPTGVDIEAFTPQPSSAPPLDLVFVGSMDWLPNIDGIDWFLEQILPRIRRERPHTTVGVVGRQPPAGLRARAAQDPRLTVTGTVPDVRPYLWNAQVSIVPLRIGGGTRLKIYEAVAARRPVVSTTIGAEGLGLRPGEEILLADAPEAFAQACLRLLADAEARERIQSAAWNTVSRNYSWERVTAQFEEILEQNRIREAVR